jgi:molybdopterin-biosynthesis enzyme MoeA-like protein
MKTPKFFALIIGTEILNRRRTDAHFDFLSKELAKYGNKLTGSFVIEDSPALIVQTIQYLASFEDSIIFSFGGIGATPDDHTRQCAATALSNGELYTHEECATIIKERLQDRVSPLSLEMAELPRNAKLIDNIYGSIPAFYLEERFFFMPGFPHMAHPMVESIIQKFFNDKKEIYRYTLSANCRESFLVDIMEQMPKEVEFSSLPKSGGRRQWFTTISVAAYNDELAKNSFDLYIQKLQANEIEYVMGETFTHPDQ